MNQEQSDIKAYYIFFGTNSSGVQNKIAMQIKEFAIDYSVELIEVGMLKRTLTRKISARLPMAPIGYDYEKAFSQINNPCFVYIRRPLADRAYIYFLARIKNKYPNCKIIVEIFTYPYDRDEFNRNFRHRLKMLPFCIKDKHYRKQLKKYVDRFVTYSKDVEIFGVPTIRTTNGTNVKQILPRVPRDNRDKGIQLISVARMQVHHGYERLIVGMGQYYANDGSRNIIYHVVGDGEEVPYYQALVKKYRLENHVVFHGTHSGAELDELYSQADIAVSSLGLYKYGINCISTLKACEYFAKGFPVVTGCNISLIGDTTPPFICEYSNDQMPLDINKLILFYDSIYSAHSSSEIISNIREFAMNAVDMKIVMRPIIEYISEN